MTPGFIADAAWPGSSRAASSPSPTSAAAANMARRGTTPAGCANKQNVFDDFIAAGEYLKAQRHRRAARAWRSRAAPTAACWSARSSTSGPTCSTRRAPAVGVMDMLRFDRFTAGRYWVDDYGYPDKEADFKTLLAYSPYHNIKGGMDYPPRCW